MRFLNGQVIGSGNGTEHSLNLVPFFYISYRPASLKSDHINELMISPTYQSKEPPLVHLKYLLHDYQSIPCVLNVWKIGWKQPI